MNKGTSDVTDRVPPGSHDTLGDWRQSARYWSKHADVIAQLLAPVSAELIKDAAISRDNLVLDVAGGVGDPSLAIARAVQPDGRVITTDAIAEMVSTARSRAIERRLDNMHVLVSNADSLPFASDSFDAAVCRFAVMLFSNPEGSITEILRVLKPGGRFAFAVWSKREANPFFHVVAEVVSRYIESTPEDPDAPGAFRFANPGKLARLVADAGGTAVQERLFDCRFEARITPEQYWPLRVEISDTLRNKIAQLPAETLKRIANEVIEKTRAFYLDGVLSFPAQVILVSAAKTP